MVVGPDASDHDHPARGWRARYGPARGVGDRAPALVGAQQRAEPGRRCGVPVLRADADAGATGDAPARAARRRGASPRRGQPRGDAVCAALAGAAPAGLRHLPDARRSPAGGARLRRRTRSRASRTIAASTSVSMAVEAAKSDGTSVALIAIDLDNLKALNDRFGHQAGDSIIQAVAGGDRGRVPARRSLRARGRRRVRGRSARALIARRARRPLSGSRPPCASISLAELAGPAARARASLHRCRRA